MRTAITAAVLLAALTAAGLYAWQRTRVTDSGASRLAEAHDLDCAGVEVVQPEAYADVLAEVGRLRDRNEELDQALAAAVRAAPRARPVAVLSASTGVQVIDPKPLTPGVQQSCLLSPGDTAEITVDEVVLQTRAGNRLLVGTATAWRVADDRVALFGGPFSAPLTEAAAVDPPPVQSWPTWRDLAELGAGVLVGGLAVSMAVR